MNLLKRFIRHLKGMPPLPVPKRCHCGRRLVRRTWTDHDRRSGKPTRRTVDLSCPGYRIDELGCHNDHTHYFWREKIR